MRYAALPLLLALTAPLHAAEMQPFTADSMQTIVQQQRGQDTLVVFWSMECLPCRQELQSLVGQEQLGGVALVLVNVDTDLSVTEVSEFLHGLGWAQGNWWQFADSFAARVRYGVDPRWQGELPRSEWLGRNGTRQSHIGLLRAEQLRRWRDG